MTDYTLSAGLESCVRCICTNDASGNPRRGWILGFKKGKDRVFLERYEGESAIPECYREEVLRKSIEVDVTPGFYRMMRVVAAEQQKEYLP